MNITMLVDLKILLTVLLIDCIRLIIQQYGKSTQIAMLVILINLHCNNRYMFTE